MRCSLFLCFLIFIAAYPIAAFGQGVELATFDTGQFGGVPEAVLTRAYAEIGLKISVAGMPGDVSLAAVNKGQYDGEVGRVAGVEKRFSNLIMLPVPIYWVDVVVMSLKAQPVKSDWDSLRPLRVAYISGVQFLERKTRGWPHVTVVRDMAHGLELLMQRKFDALIDERRHAARDIVFYEMDKVKIVEPSLERIPIYHYVHKKNASLVPRLTKVLRQLQASGFIDKLNREGVH